MLSRALAAVKCSGFYSSADKILGRFPLWRPTTKELESIIEQFKPWIDVFINVDVFSKDVECLRQAHSTWLHQPWEECHLEDLLKCMNPRHAIAELVRYDELSNDQGQPTPSPSYSHCPYSRSTSSSSNSNSIYLDEHGNHSPNAGPSPGGTSQIQRPARAPEEIYTLFATVALDLQAFVAHKHDNLLNGVFREEVGRRLRNDDIISSVVMETLDLGILEAERMRWQNEIKTSSRVILPFQKIQCDVIFDTSDQFRRVAFIEGAKEQVKHLLQFPNRAASATHWSGKAIFHFLHVYEVIGKVQFQIVELFSGDGDTRSFVFEEIQMVQENLGKRIVVLFEQLEDQIKNDTSKLDKHCVTVDQLSQRVMRCVCRLASVHRDSLQLIFQKDLTNNGDRNIRNALGHKLDRMIFSLESKLHEKRSHHFGINVDGEIFFMNNLWYIMQEGTNPCLQVVLGTNWNDEKQRNLEERMNEYMKVWENALSNLSEDGPLHKGCFPILHFKKPKSARKRLKRFTEDFESLCDAQKNLEVQDSLGMKLRTTVKNKVSTAYDCFLRTTNIAGTLGGNPERVGVRTVEDLRTQIGTLFAGL